MGKRKQIIALDREILAVKRRLSELWAARREVKSAVDENDKASAKRKLAREREKIARAYPDRLSLGLYILERWGAGESNPVLPLRTQSRRLARHAIFHIFESDPCNPLLPAAVRYYRDHNWEWLDAPTINLTKLPRDKQEAVMSAFQQVGYMPRAPEKREKLGVKDRVNMALQPGGVLAEYASRLQAGRVQ